MINILVQVDIALECARLQNRFAIPPMAAESFPQDLMFENHNLDNTTTKCDILHEILSVAQVSQDLIHQSTSKPLFSWDDPNYMLDNDDGFDFGTAKGPVYDQRTRSVETADLVEDIKVEGMTENLRWFGMSDKDLLKVHSFNYFAGKFKYDITIDLFI